MDVVSLDCFNKKLFAVYKTVEASQVTGLKGLYKSSENQTTTYSVFRFPL